MQTPPARLAAPLLNLPPARRRGPPYATATLNASLCSDPALPRAAMLASFPSQGSSGSYATLCAPAGARTDPGGGSSEPGWAQSRTANVMRVGSVSSV